MHLGHNILKCSVIQTGFQHQHVIHSAAHLQVCLDIHPGGQRSHRQSSRAGTQPGAVSNVSPHSANMCMHCRGCRLNITAAAHPQSARFPQKPQTMARHRHTTRQHLKQEAKCMHMTKARMQVHCRVVEVPVHR
jgi:hypothetical protein